MMYSMSGFSIYLLLVVTNCLCILLCMDVLIFILLSLQVHTYLLFFSFATLTWWISNHSFIFISGDSGLNSVTCLSD